MKYKLNPNFILLSCIFYFCCTGKCYSSSIVYRYKNESVTKDEYLFYVQHTREHKKDSLTNLWKQNQTIDSSFVVKFLQYCYCKEIFDSSNNNLSYYEQNLKFRTIKDFFNISNLLFDQFQKEKPLITSQEIDLYKRIRRTDINYEMLEITDSSNTTDQQTRNTHKNIKPYNSQTPYTSYKNFWPNYIPNICIWRIIDSLDVDTAFNTIHLNNKKYLIRIKNKTTKNTITPLSDSIVKLHINELTVRDFYKTYIDSNGFKNTFVLNYPLIKRLTDSVNQVRTNEEKLNSYFKTIANIPIAHNKLGDTIRYGTVFLFYRKGSLKHYVPEQVISTKAIEILELFTIVKQFKHTPLEAKITNAINVNQYMFLPKITTRHMLLDTTNISEQILKDYYHKNLENYSCRENIKVSQIKFQSMANANSAYHKFRDSLFLYNINDTNIIEPLRDTAYQYASCTFPLQDKINIFNAPIGTIVFYKDENNKHINLLKIRGSTGKTTLPFKDIRYKVEADYKKQFYNSFISKINTNLIHSYYSTIQKQSPHIFSKNK